MIVSRLKKISREREREALVKEAVHWLLFRYRVGGRIRGEPGAARALSVVVLITASYPGAQAGSNLPLSPPPFPISSSNSPPSISFLPSYFFYPPLASLPTLLTSCCHIFLWPQAGSPVSQAE